MKHPSLGKTDRLIISTLDLNSSELGKVLMKYLDEKRKLKVDFDFFITAIIETVTTRRLQNSRRTPSILPNTCTKSGNQVDGS